MRVSSRALAGTGLALLLASAPLAGQSYRETLSLYGGGSWFSDLTPQSAVETRLATNWLAGFHVDRWAGRGRIGLRLGGAYAQRMLTTEVGPTFNLYTGEAALLFRLLSPDTRRRFVPYVALGGGAIHVNSTTDASPADEYYVDPVTKPLASVALGTELFASSPVGLLFEVADHVLIESPFGDPAVADEFHPTHQAVVRLGLQIRADPIPAAPRILAAAPPPAEEEQAPAVVVAPDVAPEPSPAAYANSPVLDSVASAVEANTAELNRLRARLDGLEQALAERAAPTAPTPAAPPSAAPAPSGRLYTVQLAAFTNAEAARALADRLRRTGLPVWISQITLKGRTFHRVRAGAVPSRPEALQLARRVQREFSTPVWVAPVVQSDNPPPNVVAATRAALSGS
ncbi:MAG TPA: SPOR domain-containing protein [Longimicrobiales bacterium]